MPNSVNDPIYIIKNFGFSYPFCSKSITHHGVIKVYQGDFILLQGNSGSGKSTLILALKGLIPRIIHGNLFGEILFKGIDICNLSEIYLLNIAYLSQNPDSQLICDDVLSELAFGLENQKLSVDEIHIKINNYATEFNLTSLLRRKMSTLSGGEKQKINLLALLLMEPEVLLLDEPTAFLDPQTAVEIMNILKSYIKNKTVIIIEHNIHYVKNMVNRVLMIEDNGTIHEKCTTTVNWQPKLEMFPCKLLTNRVSSLLELRDLSFGYTDNKLLLDKLNITLGLGKIIAIRGKNGQGKSSLLKLLSGILKVKNTIFWQNTDISTIKNTKYWEYVTLLWQTSENHFLHNSVRIELDNNQNLIDELDLSCVVDCNPFNLSDGQKRRLALGIALQNDSQLFLLDEPTFGQDFNNKTNLARIINNLAMQGKSFIIVSHDVDFIYALTNSVYYLEGGKLNQC